jgi:hypothetical protein
MPRIKRRVKRRRVSSRVYRFRVTYPFGTTAIHGYRRAARHFGLRTLLDPTCEGSDDWRLLIHEDPKLLRRTAKMLLEHARSDSNNEDFLFEEDEILLRSKVHWFAHDWKGWSIEQDEGAIDSLGWSRTVTELPDGSFQVELRRMPRKKRL